MTDGFCGNTISVVDLKKLILLWKSETGRWSWATVSVQVTQGCLWNENIRSSKRISPEIFVLSDLRISSEILWCVCASKNVRLGEEVWEHFCLSRLGKSWPTKYIDSFPWLTHPTSLGTWKVLLQSPSAPRFIILVLVVWHQVSLGYRKALLELCWEELNKDRFFPEVVP